MRRIRICQIITELRPAGAERVVYELARRLDRRRFDVRVVALRGGAVAERLAEAGVGVDVLGMRCKCDAPRLVGLAGLLRGGRFDVVHTHLFHADLAARAARLVVSLPRLVHTVHVAEARFRPWHFALPRLLVGGADCIICVSRGVRDHHARRSGLPPWRYVVIPNGIDAAAYARDYALRARLREEWNVGEGQVLVAFVGRLDRQKGVDTLLSAAETLAARAPRLRFVIAGDGPQRPLVERYVAGRESGRCVFLGHVADVRGVLSAADVLAMPSRWEGFGLAAVEAMAAGLPVVATRVAGLTEIVEDGRTGVLVAPDDAEAFARAIEELSADTRLRETLGRAGRRRAVEQFDISATVSAHEALYERTAGVGDGRGLGDGGEGERDFTD